jgi:hypothetical protein
MNHKLSGFIATGTAITQGLEKFLRKNKAQILVMMTHEKHFPINMFSQSITKLMSHQTRIPLLAIKPGYKSL